MNILFLTLSSNIDIDDKQSIYGSILHELNKDGHKILVASPNERKNKKPTSLEIKENISYLRIKTGNIQKVNKIEKGISTLLIERQFKNAIKKYTKDIKFDLILYSTPPITFCNVIKYFKKRDNAKTYLMLKDIFPQNAIDLNYFSKKSPIYKYFRNKEIKLYKLSDKIGCMSPANKEYILKHNNYLEKSKVEVFPNSIIPDPKNKRNLTINKQLRKKYNIPEKSVVFMYGGNLSKPQGIDFVIKCLKETKDIKDIFYVICGTGTEYKKLEAYQNKTNQKNLLLINGLPKKEYTDLLNIADVGLIFLDYRFTIPNFPSRLLSYCEKGIPILCCTDKATDIGEIVEANNFGWKCYSEDSHQFKKIIRNITKGDRRLLQTFGIKATEHLMKYYNSEDIKRLIIYLNKCNI